MANDELMRLAAKWRSENGDYPESKRDCADELERALAQRAPQNGAVPEGMLDLVEALDAAMVESLMGEGAGIWKGNRGKLRNRLPENVGAILAKMRTLLAAAHAPEADSCAVHFYGVDYGKPGGDTTVRMTIENGRVTSIEELEPEAEREEGDVYEAYKTWPDDIRAKLSVHDLRRMSGWAPRTHVGDWRIDTSAGRPILVYQNCSVIEAETATYVLGLIARDAPPPAGQPEGVETMLDSIENIQAFARAYKAEVPNAELTVHGIAFGLGAVARRLASAQRDGKEGA